MLELTSTPSTPKAVRSTPKASHEITNFFDGISAEEQNELDQLLTKVSSYKFNLISLGICYRRRSSKFFGKSISQTVRIKIASVLQIAS